MFQTCSRRSSLLSNRRLSMLFPTAAMALIAVCITSVSYAQAVIEEVIVTATKRGAVSVQDLAGGIQAIGGDTIDDYDFRSVEEFARLSPSLNFATQGRGDSQLVIRGIQSPGSSSVGFYYDEAVITSANFQDGGGRTPDIGAYDMERIEILKGPQGTLFGASSMSGTVRLITNKPDASGLDFNATVSGLTIEHGGEGYHASGMVNIPIIEDVLAVRAVGWQEDEDGYIDQFFGFHRVGAATSPGFEKDVNSIEKTGGRVAFRWTPNDRITVDAFGLAQDTDIGGRDAFFPVPSSIQLAITPVIGIPVVEPALQGGSGDLTVTGPSLELWEDELRLYGATINVDVGFGTVTGAAHYFDRQLVAEADTTGTCFTFGLGPEANIFFGAPPGFGVGEAPCWIAFPQDRSILSSEIRFASDLDGPLNFVAGWYYQEEFTYTKVNVILADPITGVASCRTRAECLAAQDPSLVFARENEIDLDFFRIFGHADWEVTDQITIGGGVAYYESDQRTREFGTQNFQGSVPFTIPPAYGGSFQTEAILQNDQKIKQDEITFDAVGSWARNEDQLFYFRAATGFRPGSVNPPGLGAQITGIFIPPGFDPDTVISYEGGAKTTWYDGRLTFNVAYFHMDWTDIHVPGEDPTGGTEFTANAGEAGIDGVELEIFVRPAEQWFMTFGATWMNAELSKDQSVEDVTGGLSAADLIAAGNPVPPLGFEGDGVPKVPDWAFSGSVEYNVPFALLSNVDTFLRTTFSYTDSSTTLFNDNFTGNSRIGDYFLMDISASFVYENWELKLFGSNITDERAVTDIDSQPDGPDIFTVRPRTFGIQLGWEFGE